jgi:hypothetical protein
MEAKQIIFDVIKKYETLLTKASKTD